MNFPTLNTQVKSALAEHDPILAFFTDVRDTHVSGIGVKETSYYPYLANLFNSLVPFQK